MSLRCLLGSILNLKMQIKFTLIGSSDFIDNGVNIGDVISVSLGFNEDNSNIVPTKMDLSIIYEDKYILVIDKPAGIPVHPSMDHFEDSLSNGVRYYFDLNNLHRKIRIVNRLDKDTSGIVIFAKCEYVQEQLITQMQKKLFTKEYIGILDRNIR